MAVQYGYNMPMVQAPYGYQPAPMQSYAPAPVVPMAPQPIVGRNAYMIQVDGEMAAKAWQCPPDMKPGDVIPLWDADGMHVYFKSLDGYGRLNPTKKARIVFEDDAQALPENTSGRRGRDSMGRYASMDMGPNMSGHWQTPPPPMWSGTYGRSWPTPDYDPRNWR